MRAILFFCSFALASACAGMTAETSAPPPVSQLHLEKPGVHLLQPSPRKFFHRVADRARMRVKAIARRSSTSAAVLAISGMAFGILGALSLILFSYIGLYLAIPLGLVGLTLSIIGFRIARRWQGVRWINRIAMAGIILNALVVITSLVLFGFMTGT